MNKLPYERPIISRLNTGLLNKFAIQNRVEAVTHIDDVPVAELIRQYGSPVFVLSEKTIRRKIRQAYRAFRNRYPKVQFAWSYKTNYLDAVCRIFHQEQSWAEVVSRFEYEKALRNGVPGNQIIFNGPSKSDDDLHMAIENRSLIHVDHLDELYQIIEISEKTSQRPQLAIRVNMDTGIYPQWDRFGFNYENGQARDAIAKIMANPKLDLVGLHCHIGTFILSTQAYAVAAVKLCELAKWIKEQYNRMPDYLDLGGGFASVNTLHGSYLPGTDITPPMEDYAEAIASTILSAGFRTEELPLLILETGRALIDEAGYLLGTVIANKRLADGRRATILDIGVNILFTAFWYSHRISPAQESGRHLEDTVLYGPLCMNIDMLRSAISLPPLHPGDQVVVHTVGAYNMTQWMQFIHNRPAIVLIDPERKTHLIRRAETVDTVRAQEMVPDYLKNNTKP